jgi:hypothetical protein
MRAALAGLGFGVGYGAAWFLAAVIPVPLIWYLPLQHRWAFATVVTTLGMDYYGRLVLACSLGAAGALVGRSVAARAKPRWVVHGAIWVATVVGLALVLQVALLAKRHPVPLEAVAP